MPDHAIRLRGGWTLGVDGRPVDVPWTLPTDWAPNLSGPIRLTRRFGRPAVDSSTQRLRLELRDVPGLRGLTLDGVALAIPPGGPDAFSIPLPPDAGPRLTLILDVDLPDPPRPEIAGGWGAIALVIGERVP